MSSDNAVRAAPLSGVIRSCNEDFVVDELLGFEPDGDGEHVLVQLQKNGANTAWVAARLAELAGVRRRDVGFAGRKDRHAVATQWFSIWMPGSATPTVADWSIDGVEVLAVHRHRRKLRPGSLAANRFDIVVRDLRGSLEPLESRVARLRQHGVPNFFGAQRFGRDHGNIARARELFAGARLPRNQRSLALSAARAQIFNAVLSARVEQGTWLVLQPGDCLNLDGSRSFFLADGTDTQLSARLQAGDIHVTGPLWGAGELPSRHAVARLEQNVAAEHRELADGLARAGLRHERRALRIVPRRFDYATENDKLRLRFTLAPGLFATAVLSALLELRDAH